jgi:hypothetical protein
VSTILKALQRLEYEKSANFERSLDEQVVARRPPRVRERGGMKIGVVAIGGLTVAAVAFLFWPTREEPDADVAMEVPPPATAPAREPAPAVAAATKVAAEKPRRRSSARKASAARAQQDSSEVEVSSVVEVVKRLDAPPADPAAADEAPKRAAPSAKAKAGDARPARRKSTRKPKVAREAAQPKPAPEQVANAESPAPRTSENSVSAKPLSAPPVPAEVVAAAPKPAPVTPAPVEIAAVAAKPPPTASVPAPAREPERKVVQRASVPPLSVEKTIWHPDAYRRVAVVKLIDAEEVLRLKEGDAVGPLVVRTINPGSVLFNHDGIEIRYNVGG